MEIIVKIFQLLSTGSPCHLKIISAFNLGLKSEDREKINGQLKKCKFPYFKKLNW
jgi:hypothetical protein